LRNECQVQRCVPSVGEPTAVGDAARQSALHLPGEKDGFLRVKLLEPPVAHQQRAEIAAEISVADLSAMADGPQQPSIALNLTAAQARLLAVVLQRGALGLDAHQDLWELEKELRAFADDPQGYVEGRRPAEHERYEKLLRTIARLRYPERTPELEARIEKTVQKKVAEFRQEQQVREYEASLRRRVAERHPHLTQEEAQHYDRRIKALVDEHRQRVAWKPMQQARSQRQERGHSLER
jgi:hypothetical protein